VKVERIMSELKTNANDTVGKFVQVPILVPASQSVRNAAREMAERKTGSVVIVRGEEPIGILTEWDILTRVVAPGKDPNSTKVEEVMSKPLVMVDPNMKVSDAISLMVEKGFRRLGVKQGTKLSGIVTISMVIGNSKGSSIATPMIEPAKGARCPYCGSILKDRDELSRHIDDIHVREEVLHGIHNMPVD
jgi:CBS domain-containing protein